MGFGWQRVVKWGIADMRFSLYYYLEAYSIALQYHYFGDCWLVLLFHVGVKKQIITLWQKLQFPQRWCTSARPKYTGHVRLPYLNWSREKGKSGLRRIRAGARVWFSTEACTTALLGGLLAQYNNVLDIHMQAGRDDERCAVGLNLPAFCLSCSV